MTTPRINKSSKSQNLHQIYIYQVQEMRNANWLYDGFVPRTEDPNRVHVFLSKRGYTVRVQIQFTQSEVAAYPKYLIERAATIERVRSERGIRILQTARYQRYQNVIEDIRRQADVSPGYSYEKYTQGLNLLLRHFPENIRIEQVSMGEERVILNMVYPLTIHRGGQRFPPAGDYRLFMPVEERRSYHCANRSSRGCQSYDHIFSGFPAFWIHPTGVGVGAHAPIRYSRADDPPNKAPGYHSIPELWADNEFLNEEFSPREQIDPVYRWDLVRTNNSKGCFRTEPLEIRHLLPSQPDDVSQVVWTVLDDFDRVVMEPSKGEQIVNVGYYVINPYAKPIIASFDVATQKWNNTDWFFQHYLTEAQRARSDSATILDRLLEQVHTFPYHSPHALEFVSRSGEADEPTMRLLNRTPYPEL